MELVVIVAKELVDCARWVKGDSGELLFECQTACGCWISGLKKELWKPHLAKNHPKAIVAQC